MLILIAALLSSAALAADEDGDGVDSATDCDDTDPDVWREEASVGGIYTLRTDAEVEAFCDGYCARRFRTLKLVDVTTTDGLECVERLNNTLDINAPELDSLHGLINLSSVGTLLIGESNLSDLTGLDGLSTLSRLWIGCVGGPDGGHADLVDELMDCVEAPGENLSLSSLAGLSGVTSLSALYVRGTALPDLNGLNALTSVGNLVIYDVPTLTSLRGLDALRTATNFRIAASSGLTDLRGLGSLTRVTALGLEDLAGLERVSGPGSLTTVGSLTLSENTRLRDLRGLSSLTSLTNLYLSDLTRLTDLSGLEGVSTAGLVQLSGLPSLSSLSGLDGLTQVETLKLIDTPMLAGLDGLERLQTVESELSLGCGRPYGGSEVVCSEVPRLTSLAPLSSLTSVGSLSLTLLPALTSLDGLSGLTDLGDLVIDGTGVTSLDGLEGLTTLGDVVLGCHTSTRSTSTTTYTDCWGNPALADLSGLSGVTEIGALRIVKSDGLERIEGLDALTALGDVEIAEDRALSYIQDLPSVERLTLGCYERFVRLNGAGDPTDESWVCPGLASLAALPEVHLEEGGSVALFGAPLVSSLEGLSGPTSLSGLSLANMSGLTDLSGLESLTEVTNLWIGVAPLWTQDGAWASSPSLLYTGNAGLLSLDGLEELRDVRDLRISNNSALRDLTALYDLHTATRFYVTDNPSLAPGAPAVLLGEVETSPASSYCR